MAKIADTFDKARKLAAARQFDRALRELRLIVLLDPKHIGAHQLAAAVLMRDLGRPELALEHLAALARLDPDNPVAIANYAGTLALLGRAPESLAPLRAGLARFPRHPNLRDNLLAALVKSGAYAEAIEVGRPIIADHPENGIARQNLATALQDVGLIAEARAAIAGWIGPLPPAVLAQRATLRNYDESEPSAAAFEEHTAFGRSLTPPPNLVLAPSSRSPRSPGTPLRIGFLSPDLRRHSVSFFIEPLLSHLPAAADIFVYKTSAASDDTTTRLAQYPVKWRSVPNLPPRELAAAISVDALDVLVELSGLTLGNALAALSLRPAPVQITYLGYPNTTGCPFIDLRIADAITDPPDSPRTCTETILRIEPCFLCYQPPSNSSTSSTPPNAPSLSAPSPGVRFTFGCFGAASKHSPRLLELWRRVLEAAPQARLLLKSVSLTDDATLNLMRDRLASSGIPVERVEFRPSSPDLAAHLAMYNDVDLSLDTFPYHGTTTTCESLLMGVPMLTLAGQTHAARVGPSLLQASGFAADIASHPDQFIAIAAQRAAAGQRGIESRREARARFLSSPVCDGAGFSARFLQTIHDALEARATR